MKSRENEGFEKSEELKLLYQKPDIIKETRKRRLLWARMKERRNFCADGSIWSFTRKKNPRVSLAKMGRRSRANDD